MILCDGRFTFLHAESAKIARASLFNLLMIQATQKSESKETIEINNTEINTKRKAGQKKGTTKLDHRW